MDGDIARYQITMLHNIDIVLSTYIFDNLESYYIM